MLSIDDIDGDLKLVPVVLLRARSKEAARFRCDPKRFTIGYMLKPF